MLDFHVSIFVIIYIITFYPCAYGKYDKPYERNLQYNLASTMEPTMVPTDHLEDGEPYFLSDDSDKLLNTCTEGDDCLHPSCNVSYFICTEETIPKLRRVQNLVSRMLYHANHPVRVPIVNILFLIWFIQGLYLVKKKHFDWRNLPGTSYVWLPDPCDGIARYFRKWLKFTVIDETHPKFHDTNRIRGELEQVDYIPNIYTWPPAGVHIPDPKDFTDEWSYKKIIEEEPDESLRIFRYYDHIAIRIRRDARSVPYHAPPTKEVFATKRKTFEQRLYESNIKEPNVDYYFDSDYSEGNPPQMTFKDWSRQNKDRRHSRHDVVTHFHTHHNHAHTYTH